MSCINLLFDGEWLSIANGLICGNAVFRPAISLVSLEVPRVTPCSTWNLPRDSSSHRSRFLLFFSIVCIHCTYIPISHNMQVFTYNTEFEFKVTQTMMASYICLCKSKHRLISKTQMKIISNINVNQRRGNRNTIVVHIHTFS